jgi:hypothetical protein
MENIVELLVGVEIYYGGDMANHSGFGKIVERTFSRFGDNLKIEMEDGRVINVPPVMFSEKYLGHGGTRFVTREAYDTYRRAAVDQFCQRHQT